MDQLPTLPADIATLPSDALRRPILHAYPKTVFGKQNRSFSSTLYDKYNFIEYSIEADAVYCFACRFFGSTVGHSQETLFTTKGFKNWKRCDRISDHCTSKYHKESVVGLVAFKSSSHVGSVIQQQLSYNAQMVRENREYVKSLARIAVFCGRQNIALRGHDEALASSNRGNFLEMVDLVAVESVEFRNRKESMAANAKYLSSDSQNALIEAAARCILAEMEASLQKSGMYAIITDGCTDMACDNLSVCVRYVDMDSGFVHERFLQFTDLSANELSAASVTDKITAILQQGTRFHVSLENCVSQASDGASVMSGKDNGVQKLFRDKTNNPCIFVHCYGHRLNLVLSVASTHVQSSKEFFDLVRRAISFINVSIKRKAIFSDMQTNDTTKPVVSVILPQLCEHKWNFRERAVSIIHSRYSYLLKTMDFITENGKPDERFEAEGILTQLMKPLNVCLLVLMSDIFSQFGPLSNVLQSEKCDIASAIQLASSHLQVLKDKRSDEHFHKLWLVSQDLASCNDIELAITAKRKKKIPAKIAECITETTLGHREPTETLVTQTPEEHYRTSVFFLSWIDLYVRWNGDSMTKPLCRYSRVSVCATLIQNYFSTQTHCSL